VSDDSKSILDRYERLTRYVGLDLLDMEEMFMRTPRIHQEAGELAVQAEQAKAIAKHNVELAIASAAAELREIPVDGPRGRGTPSEARIDSMVVLDETVRQAQEALITATAEAGVCTVLYRTLGEQSRLLAKAADMVTSGYLNPVALHDQRRAEYRRARAEADRRQHQQQENH